MGGGGAGEEPEHGSERGKQRDRLQPMAWRVFDGVHQDRRIGEEDRVHLLGLRALHEALVEAEIGEVVDLRLGVAPGGLVMAVGLDEEVEGIIKIVSKNLDSENGKYL